MKKVLRVVIVLLALLTFSYLLYWQISGRAFANKLFFNGMEREAKGHVFYYRILSDEKLSCEAKITKLKVLNSSEMMGIATSMSEIYDSYKIDLPPVWHELDAALAAH